AKNNILKSWNTFRNYLSKSASVNMVNIKDRIKIIGYCLQALDAGEIEKNYANELHNIKKEIFNLMAQIYSDFDSPEPYNYQQKIDFYMNRKNND
ncbi:unnamed protein product, partial [marine sediment metagenome]